MSGHIPGNNVADPNIPHHSSMGILPIYQSNIRRSGGRECSKVTDKEDICNKIALDILCQWRN